MQRSAFLIPFTLLLAAQLAYAEQRDSKQPAAQIGSAGNDFIGQIIENAILEQEAKEAREQQDFEAYRNADEAVVEAINKQISGFSYKRNSAPKWFDGRDYDLPVVYNSQVDAVIKYFSGKGQGFFTKWLQRSEEMKPLILPILREYGVPEDLFFLSMIESGFSMKATSTVGAAGPWQFMVPTGRDFNLRIENDRNGQRYIDERMDLLKSTRAAARYLKRLYKVFGDWNLAMASYNWGQGKVQQAINHCGSNNYWELANSKWMPEETKQYVPKVYAAAIIYKNAERFGFKKPRDIEVSPLVRVKVPNGLTFSQIATVTGVSLENISKYNNALIGHKTPNAGAFNFYVSSNFAPQIIGKYNTLNALALKSAPAAPVSGKNGATRYHKVKKGETITAIAKKYNCQPAQIRKLNKLKNDNIKIGTTLKIPGVISSTAPVSVASAQKAPVKPAAQTTAKAKAPAKPAAQTTAKAKAPAKPAAQTAAKAKAPAKPAAQTAAKAKAPAKPAAQTAAKAKAPAKPVKVKVQSGDSLWKIANKYGITVQKLLALNNHLDAKKPLIAGTMIRVAEK